MNQVFLQIIQNKYVYIPILTWFFIQIFKIIYELITTKKLNFKRIIGAGGMPSAHSAVVMCITVMVGKDIGFDSSSFAMCLVFSTVVMYDAAGVRRAAGKQATLLNKIIETPGLSDVEVHERLVEVLGHTPVQVFVGAFLGILIGAMF